jgi:peptide/nickel transport system permease protein
MAASPQVLIGAVLLLLVASLAVFAPFFVPLQGAGVIQRDASPSVQHWMGTGTHSQDILDQWVYAARFSLEVGFLAGAGSTMLSILIGVSAGYLGGWVDDVLGFVISVFLLVPPFPLIFILAFGFGVVGAGPLIVLLTCTTWAYGASLLRSQTLSLRRRDFVEAAIGLGERSWQTMRHEVLPHLRGLMSFVLINVVLFALQSEFGLEFLGWSVGGSSGLGGGWGVMMYNAHYDNDFEAGVWWTWAFPGLGIAVTSAALALISAGIAMTGVERGRRATPRRRLRSKRMSQA